MRDQGPQTKYYCNTVRQPCMTPWECCSGQRCRVAMPATAPDMTMQQAMLANFKWWLKVALTLVLVAFIAGIFSPFFYI